MTVYSDVSGSQPLKAVQSSVEVNEDETVNLSCQVARFTSTLVRWSFNNEFLQLGSRMAVVNSSSNGTVYNTLHIRKVNVTDSGKYKCSGEFNGIDAAADIQLKVRGKRISKRHVLMCPCKLVLYLVRTRHIIGRNKEH